MNEINSGKFETCGRNITRKRSSPGCAVFWIYSFSPSVALAKLGFKKISYDVKGKDCVNTSKIPRPPMTTSYSFNETLKSNQSNGKTKKAPSMIPRSKARKRNENAKIRIDIPSKAESPKKYFNKCSDPSNKVLSETSAVYEFELPPFCKLRKLPVFGEYENALSKEEVEISSLSLKPCRNVDEDKDDDTDTSFPETQKDVPLESQAARKEEEVKRSPVEEKLGVNDEELEEGREDRNIRHLYEAIKCTVGPFRHLKRVNVDRFMNEEFDISSSESAMTRLVDGAEAVSESSSIQEHYDFTLREITNIWKSTVSLMASVKSHAKKFMEENNKLIDKEQLSLESEMLQAALDFAICYSKLKTDFLLTLVKERLNPRLSATSKLENLMDSKIFATLYNVEDLAMVAQNVHDLSRSLLKGEDSELY